MDRFPHLDDHAPQRRPETVLIVDDSRTNLNVLGARLGRMGYMVVLCDGGAEALNLIAGGGFDLVLLDMMMPGVDGLAVLREIRGAPDTRDLPVVMVTARGDPQAAVDALATGADDHLAKPYAIDVLAARIERTLARGLRIEQLKRSNAALDARVAARAIELGEAREALASSDAERARLLASLGRGGTGTAAAR